MARYRPIHRGRALPTRHLGLYAFFTMVMFGSMYYIVPRLVGREWRYASLIKLHFWASAYGIGLMVLMLLVGGLVQGLSMNDPTLSFTESTQSVLPYLRGRSLSGVLMTVSHFVFAFHFGLMLLGLGRTASVPTFLESGESEPEDGRALMKGLHSHSFSESSATFAFSWLGLTLHSEFADRPSRSAEGRRGHRRLSGAAIWNGRARPARLRRERLRLLPQRNRCAPITRGSDHRTQMG